MTSSRPLLLGLSLVLAACGGEGLILPPEGAAARIEVMSGNGQSGRVGSPLKDSLVVRVTDTQGRTVAGANVEFEFTADGSAASPASAISDANGRAASRLVVGTRVGPVSGIVRVPVDPGFAPVQAAITATALSDNANGIALLSGNEQSGQVGTDLPAPLVVVVTDAFGNPIAGVAVEWSVTGGGSVSPATSITGADGQASATRTLGPTAGEQTATATAPGLDGSPVTFTHTATAGSATGVVKVSGDGQSGSPGTELAQPLVVQVLDGTGNPIPNRPLTWTIGEGGGSVSPENTTTDAQGRASTRWTLGPGVGTNTVNAVVSGLPPATFSATATAGAPSASNSTVSTSRTTIDPGEPTQITVTVRDAGNNPVAGASVSIASTGTGNTITPASASTGSNGVATFTFSSTVGETKTITATAGGVAITDGATVTVRKLPSATQIESDTPDPSAVGEAVRVVFTVTGAGGTPTGQVIVTADGGAETCSATVAEGFCDITFTSAGANRRLTATYQGDDRYGSSFDRDNHLVVPAAPASTTTTITSDSPDPSAAGALVTVTFTVTSTAGTPTGTVAVTDPMGGGCSASVAAGSCDYTPGGTGLRTITATYGGSAGFSGSSDTEDHTVTAPPANVAPTANPDGYLMSSQSITEVQAIDGVLANDSDPDNGPQPLIARNPSVPGQGTVDLRPDGSFTYTPGPTAVGSDSFTYEAFDGAAATTATVTITFTALRRN